MNIFGLGYFNLALAPPSGGYADMPAAMIGYLRAQPAVVAAFGDDMSALASTKFWGDSAQPTVALPWATYEEMGEDQSPVSTDANGVVNYFCRGRIVFHVVAASKQLSRTLAKLVLSTLNDAPLTFDDGTLLELRGSLVSAPVVRDIAPNSPIAYDQSVVFLYMVQRQD